MDQANQSPTSRAPRRDGWTAERRRKFLGYLARGIDVRRSCAGVGLSREAAYNLRRRDPTFAQEWHAALQTARDTAEAAWLAMLPAKLRRTMSELSGECELRGDGSAAQDTVRTVQRV
jgi:hypothetical protein